MSDSYGGTLRDDRSQCNEGTTDVILIFSQPRVLWARGGLCPALQSLPSVINIL
jgi:hypothetical protein